MEELFETWLRDNMPAELYQDLQRNRAYNAEWRDKLIDTLKHELERDAAIHQEATDHYDAEIATLRARHAKEMDELIDEKIELEERICKLNLALSDFKLTVSTMLDLNRQLQEVTTNMAAATERAEWCVKLA